MARIPHTLVYDFLELAEGLCRLKGRTNFQQAALRRAVSTAYYALFHALYYVCSDGLVRWSRTDLVARTYRSLDHGSARNRLNELARPKDAQTSLKEVSAAFSDLQSKRHLADYERSRLLFTKSGVLADISRAREAVDLIAGFDEDMRRWLAVELLLPRRLP